MKEAPPDIPWFLLRDDDPVPLAERERVARRFRESGAKTGPLPASGWDANTNGMVTLVKTVTTTGPITGTRGPARQAGYLDGIDVGTVLVRRPVLPGIPYYERPWQAGRVHLDGVRWEEKLWPEEDEIDFLVHVASLLEFTVPGDERWRSRNLPVVG